MQVDIKRRQSLVVLAGSIAFPMAGCGGGMAFATSASSVVVPKGGSFKFPTKLPNVAAKAAEFEATLIAATSVAQIANGPATTVWAYNGLYPGPMIDVREGDTVRIVFKNQLSQTSTIHWHGLPIPPEQDGNPMDMVLPGSTRTYTFTLPLGSAGTYWFHPHPHQTTHQQVFMGLAGSFIVRPALDPLAGIPERVILITDLRLDANNQIVANNETDLMNGREGDQLLVNGVKLPLLEVQPGTTERWRVINATNARYLRLSLGGESLRLVGHGGGLIERAQEVNETLLAPAQRVEFLVQAGATQGQQLLLKALPYDRGAMVDSIAPEVSILTLSSTLAGSASPITIPLTLRSVAALSSPVSTRRFILTESMGMSNAQFRINNRSFDPMRIDVVSKVNDIEDWVIENQGDMDHPFHIHGTQFQLISSTRTDTTPSTGYRAWIDTINIRSGELVTIRIQQTMLGKRMFHCHILEHEDQGMMGVLDVQGLGKTLTNYNAVQINQAPVPVKSVAYCEERRDDRTRLFLTR